MGSHWLLQNFNDNLTNQTLPNGKLEIGRNCFCQTNGLAETEIWEYEDEDEDDVEVDYGA